MKAAANKVVTIEYTLKDGEGEILDSSDGGEPLAYLHGAGNIVEGLEKALTGKGAGDAVQVVVAPAEGYGDRDDELVSTMPRSQFPKGKVSVGQVFHAQTEQGPMAIQVTAVEGDEVTVDGNHPLAGETLHFDVKVLGVRDATSEELTHGHVHGAGGHHH